VREMVHDAMQVAKHRTTRFCRSMVLGLRVHSPVDDH
jgi:hypothetical protein